MKKEIKAIHQFGMVFVLYLVILYLSFSLLDVIKVGFLVLNNSEAIGSPYETAPLHFARFVLSLVFLRVLRQISLWSLEWISLPLWGTFLGLIIHYCIFSVNQFLIPAFDILIFSMAYIQTLYVDDAVKEMIISKEN